MVFGFEAPEFVGGLRLLVGSPSRCTLGVGHTQRLHSSSFLGLPYRILKMIPKKELLWSLRVGIGSRGAITFNPKLLYNVPHDSDLGVAKPATLLILESL